MQLKNKMIDMSRGVPPVEVLPVEKIAQCAENSIKNYGDSLLQYHSDLSKTVQGFIPLIKLIAEELGNEAREENILIGNGSLDILDILANSLINPGDDVFVESPSYDRAITTLSRAGGKVTGIPMEGDGLDLASLDKLASEKNPALIYLIPDFQNPSGITTSAEKRRRLMKLAKKHEFWIIEDSPYHKLRYRGNPKPLLWEMAPERVIYMSSYSKLISPGLRVGWTVIPPNLTKKVFQYAEDSYIIPSMLSQGVVYEFIKRGWLETNLETLKESYVIRLDTLIENLERHLSEANWITPNGGFFVGLNLPEGIFFEHLVKQADKLGLIFSDSRKFFPDEGEVQFLRIPFCTLSPEEIEEAIKRIKSAI